MEFEFQKRRNITDEEYIGDMRRVASILNSETLSCAEYSKMGKYNSTSIRRRFGTWNNALKRANLQILQQNYTEVSKEDFINDIKRVAKILDVKSLSNVQYKQYGKYKYSKILDVFKTWNKALKEAKLYYVNARNLSEDELFDNLLNVWQKLGRQPYYKEMKQPLSICSAKPYVTVYGSWYNALEKFVLYMNTNEEDTILDEKDLDNKQKIKCTENKRRKTPRNINLRLRYKVLKRDNFKCVICGRSPAKNPDIELQVDHIIPYSKGGETVIENLRTLCSECNLGKSDLM